MRKKLLYSIILVLLVPLMIFAKGKLTFVKGKVYYKNKTSKVWKPAKLNMKLKTSDMIKVGKKSVVIIKFKDGSKYTIKKPKTMKIGKIEKIVKSRKKSKINKFIKKKGIQSSGPTAVAGVRGADISEKSKTNKIQPDKLKWEK